MKELKQDELMEINGGDVGYFKYTWTATDNELVYAFQAISNGVKAVLNGGIWVYNQLF
jgi:hypothetical protein